MDWRFHLTLCLTNHLPPARLTVTFLSAPSTSRLLRYRTQPSLGSKMRLLFCSRQVPCGWRKLACFSFFLKTGSPISWARLIRPCFSFFNQSKRRAHAASRFFKDCCRACDGASFSQSVSLSCFQSTSTAHRSA